MWERIQEPTEATPENADLPSATTAAGMPLTRFATDVPIPADRAGDVTGDPGADRSDTREERAAEPCHGGGDRPHVADDGVGDPRDCAGDRVEDRGADVAGGCSCIRDERLEGGGDLPDEAADQVDDAGDAGSDPVDDRLAEPDRGVLDQGAQS